MITQGDIETRVSDESTLQQLTDLDHTGTVDSTIVDEAISSSTGLVEAYITLPDPLTPLVRGILIDMAVYYLYLWAVQRAVIEIPEAIKTGYRNNIDLLRQLQNKALVADPDADADPNAGAIWQSDAPVFYPGGDGLGEVF